MHIQYTQFPIFGSSELIGRSNEKWFHGQVRHDKLTRHI